jgi:L-ascorbate metabolism protein UlaG (beta-lactamase superfamily)
MSLLKGTRVTWLGHATVLITTPGGLNVLIDPFIEHNPKFPKDFKLPAKIDYLLLTHGHGDHIADAAPVAQATGAKVVAIFELANYLQGKGVAEVIGMNLGGTMPLPGVAVTMVDAKHTSSVQEDPTLYVGEAGGFVISIEGGPVLYHAGDTAVFGDMALIREMYAPEVAMLPIGGCYTMGPKEAAVAVKLLEPKLILPLHWGTFPPLTGTPEQLAKLIDQPDRVAIVEPGESL